MAASKDVMTVIGMLCVNQQFKTDFFADPAAAAGAVVGALRDDEVEQIQRLAFNGFTQGPQRVAYIDTVKQKFDGVFNALCGGTCPSPPCPCPDDPSDLY